MIEKIIVKEWIEYLAQNLPSYVYIKEMVINMSTFLSNSKKSYHALEREGKMASNINVLK